LIFVLVKGEYYNSEELAELVEAEMRDEEKRELAAQRQKSGGEGDQPVFDNILDDKVKPTKIALKKSLILSFCSEIILHKICFRALELFNIQNNVLYRKSDFCIPRNETAWPHSQFLQSCIC